MIGVLSAVAIGLLSASVPPTSEPKEIPPGFVPLIDDTGSIVVAAPEPWNEIDTSPAVNDDGTPRPYIAAAPDIEGFLESFEVPGMVYSAFPFTDDPLELIDRYGLNAGCESIEVRTYDDPIFSGVIQIGTDCGPHDMTWNMVAASPADQSFTAVVQVQAVADVRRETVLLTFNVAGETGVQGSGVPDSSLAASTTSTAPAPTTTGTASTSTTVAS